MPESRVRRHPTASSGLRVGWEPIKATGGWTGWIRDTGMSRVWARFGETDGRWTGQRCQTIVRARVTGPGFEKFVAQRLFRTWLNWGFVRTEALCTREIGDGAARIAMLSVVTSGDKQGALSESQEIGED